MPTLRVVGPGRAGLSLCRALETAGWRVLAPLGRADDVRGAASGTDLLVLATPDAVVASVARSIEPLDGTVVAHLAGSLPLEVLTPHPRRASLHPLVALPDPGFGADRLRGAWFAVAGDPLVEQAVADLGGTAVRVPDEARAAYHAAACMASNALVALLASVQRVAAEAGVPLDAFLDLVRGTVENVGALGPVEALTGPVSRGDWATIERHRAALPESERALYEALLDATVAVAARKRAVVEAAS